MGAGPPCATSVPRTPDSATDLDRLIPAASRGRATLMTPGGAARERFRWACLRPRAAARGVPASPGRRGDCRAAAANSDRHSSTRLPRAGRGHESVAAPGNRSYIHPRIADVAASSRTPCGGGAESRTSARAGANARRFRESVDGLRPPGAPLDAQRRACYFRFSFPVGTPPWSERQRRRKATEWKRSHHEVHR